MLFLTASQHPDLTSRFSCRNARASSSLVLWCRRPPGRKTPRLDRSDTTHCWARARSPRGQRGVYVAKVNVQRVRALVSQSSANAQPLSPHRQRRWQRRLERRQTDPRSEDPAMNLNAVAEVKTPGPVVTALGGTSVVAVVGMSEHRQVRLLTAHETVRVG
jgi:hypothetical protein